LADTNKKRKKKLKFAFEGRKETLGLSNPANRERESKKAKGPEEISEGG